MGDEPAIVDGDCRGPSAWAVFGCIVWSRILTTLRTTTALPSLLIYRPSTSLYRGEKRLFAAQDNHGRIVIERAATREVLHIRQNRLGGCTRFLERSYEA